MEDRAIVDEVLGVLGTGRQIAPLTSRRPGLEFADAYRVARTICDRRIARGDRPVGRKIGFTNRSAWTTLKVAAPVWGYIYASTVHDLGPDSHVPLAGLAEPRIEPEIIFGLATAPTPDMEERQLGSTALDDLFFPANANVNDPRAGVKCENAQPLSRPPRLPARVERAFLCALQTTRRDRPAKQLRHKVCP